MIQKNDVNTRVSVFFYGHSIAGVVETFLICISLQLKFVVQLIAAGPCRTQSLIRWTLLFVRFQKISLLKSHFIAKWFFLRLFFSAFLLWLLESLLVEMGIGVLFPVILVKEEMMTGVWTKFPTQNYSLLDPGHRPRYDKQRSHRINIISNIINRQLQTVKHFMT